jgi:tRNA(Ile)-lysidine synthase
VTGIRPAGDPVTVAVGAWLAAGHVPAAAPLLVACSGGADSLALADAVLRAAADRQPVAATVDHGLQPGSDRVARSVADALRRLGYRRVEVLPVTVDGPGGVEAAARTARYGALRALAESLGPDTGVLLGHTADDQAETVLLGLARGSGPRSIAGMRPWRAPWGRPLLPVRRADTEAACAAAGLTPWQDPHNADPAFTRVRLRREVLPLLDRVLGGGAVPALARTADLMADDLCALDDLAGRALREAAGADGTLDRAALAAWPAAVRRRVLRIWAGDAGGLTFQHLVRLDGLVTDARSGSAVRLPGGRDAVRRRDRLVLLAPADPSHGSTSQAGAKSVPPAPAVPDPPR